MSTQQKNGSNMIAVVTMVFIFAMISFVTNLAAPMGNIWKGQFEGSNFLGMMGNMMNFLAYAVMGIPAGKMLVKVGYKKTALSAMAIGVIGLFVQFLSSKIGAGTAIHVDFIIYLLGAFICGFCVCMLNTVVNPMLNLLGGSGNKGNQYIQIGGTFNSLVGTMTPLFVGALIGTIITDPEVAEKMGRTVTTMGDVTPMLFIGMGILALAFIIISFVAIPEPHLRSKGEVKVKDAHSPWSFRHVVLGVICIGIYVGVEIGIPATLNLYLADKDSSAGILEKGAAIGGAVAAMYWLMMLVGRFASTLISGKVSSKTQLVTVSSVAILFVIIAIFLPTTTKILMPGYSVNDAIEGGFLNGFISAEVPINALFLVLCGLCTSVMWGTIYNLAVEGLGKYTAQASGIFMAFVVGGGILPLVQQLIVGENNYINSYWLIVAALVFILYYALVGCKNVNKDIPVE